MADMNLPEKGGRRRVQPPRIDLTPMVDLGFLLITFFMFTTTLAQNKTLELNMPDRTPVETPQAWPAESTLTLLPAAHHRMYYYTGAYTGAPLQHCPMAQVPQLVLRYKQQAQALPAHYSAHAHRLHVLIKATNHSLYADLVHTIDALLINDVQDYALIDPSAEEEELVMGR